MPRPRSTSRQEARGRFYTGAGCRHGHPGTRYVSTGACVECVARLKVTWRARVAVTDDFDQLLQGV